MGLFKLIPDLDNSKTGSLEKIDSKSIDYEKDFENWLENSPCVLIDENDEDAIFWISRQQTAPIGDSGKFPDLLGINSDGSLVIVELKKGKTPREVVAQLLEYSTWGAGLTYEDLDEITRFYFKSKEKDADKNLLQKYREIFCPDLEEYPEINFNKNQKLYIVAEEISPVVMDVCNHLRNFFGVDINCIEYKVSKSKQGEFIISTERIVGYDKIGSKSPTSDSHTKWSHNIKVKDIIIDTIKEITKNDYSITFAPADIIKIIMKQYPDVNKNTVRCQIISNCVNHSSRKYYVGGKDLCFLTEKGIYRLYDPGKDGKWNSKAEKI
jgi:hypothetical protein